MARSALPTRRRAICENSDSILSSAKRGASSVSASVIERRDLGDKAFIFGISLSLAMANTAKVLRGDPEYSRLYGKDKPPATRKQQTSSVLSHNIEIGNVATAWPIAVD